MFQTSDIEQQTLQMEKTFRQRDDKGAVESRIEKRYVRNDPDLTYYLFEARRRDPLSPLLVAVHGISRQAEEQALLFAPLVNAVGGTLVAPFFPQDRFPDYQRLGRQGRGERSDLALKQVLEDAAARTGKSERTLAMFGYSGGGQFVHRYAMAYPRQVARMAVAAPGWFTFPKVDSKFPLGLKKNESLPDLNFDPARFLKIPAMVLVGENDISRDGSLNQNAKIDRLQGTNRMERACRWLSAMSAAATRYNYDTAYEFIVVTGCGHSFAECMTEGAMGALIVAFLIDGHRQPAGFGKQAPELQTASQV